MKALVATDYGSPPKVTVADVPNPTPGPGQVLVRVEAAALNPFDLALLTGSAMREMIPLTFPFVVGMDAAGTVAGVGEGVTGYAVGDPVLGWSGFASGTVAEYALIPEGLELAKRPAGLDAVRAAAIPESGVTAAHLLRVADAKPGQRMLVVGATGGVGMYVVQLAAAAGVEVIATAKLSDDAYVRGLGARQTIDYTQGDLAEAVQRLIPGGVDVAIDVANSGPALEGTGRAVQSGGRVASPLGGPENLGRNVKALYIGQKQAVPGLLADLASRAATGKLQIEVAATYPLVSGPQAIADFATQHRRGKTVITVP